MFAILRDGVCWLIKIVIGTAPASRPSSYLRGFVARRCGPAFVANSSRNFVMASSSFIVTPWLYRQYFPQESKSQQSLLAFGLAFNIFGGNVIAITQQSLWGRALDYGARHGGQPINYRSVIKYGLARDGMAAFFTPTKWFSRVLMNAPAQGTMPWFYNHVLPKGEPAVMSTAKSVYCAVQVK